MYTQSSYSSNNTKHRLKKDMHFDETLVITQYANICCHITLNITKEKILNILFYFTSKNLVLIFIGDLIKIKLLQELQSKELNVIAYISQSHEYFKTRHYKTRSICLSIHTCSNS